MNSNKRKREKGNTWLEDDTNKGNKEGNKERILIEFY